MKQPPPSLMHAMDWVLREDPERDAVVFKGRRISYIELVQHSVALANRLQEMGVKVGDNVAALVSPRPEALVTLFATWIIGATWVGVNTRYKLVEQKKLLEDCKAQVLISIDNDGNRDLSGDLITHKAAGLCVIRIGKDLWEGDLPKPVASRRALDHWSRALDRISPNDPAVIIYTSGSTGQPKGAINTHAGLAFRSFTMSQDRFGIGPIRLLLDLPVNHIGALASGVGLTLVSGGLMIMSEKFDPGYSLEMIETERLNVFIGVPAMLTRFVEHPRFKQTDLSSLQFMSWGAGPISERVLNDLLNATKAAFTQQYGMTESNGPIVYTPPTRDVDILLGTTGVPDKRLEVRIADEADRALPTNTVGEVQVRMPHPFAGYLNNPEATAEIFTTDGYLRTGDRAKFREDGHLVFSGRSKEMYKSGGFNVFPREIEVVLEAHPAIRAAAVIGKEDRDWGQIGVAFVELNESLSKEDIRAWCNDRLANFKVPKEILMLQALPRTPVDKVDKVALSKLSSESDASNRQA